MDRLKQSSEQKYIKQTNIFNIKTEHYWQPEKGIILLGDTL